jgi:hypothetical protein
MLTIHRASSNKQVSPVFFFKAVFLCSVVVLAGCAGITIPKDALILSPSSLADRQLQSRVYEDVSEADILSASVGIMQDLGATITETESDLGLIVGEKMRDATDPGQVAGALVMAVLLAPVAIDKRQKIKFSLVTTPVSSAKSNNRWLVRLTIQRIVWNTQNQVSRIEAVRDADIFQEFFEKLDKSLFLEQQS